ncbi:MAG: PQQ-binding-like beta-propeller repeat protein [Planctomycetia bacterium]|nr:PQQ-binding-like beta-propeller repeat protein [Planctomycetia bacterium]
MHRPLPRLAAMWCLAIVACAALRLTADENWPQFRGPLALGVADNPNLPDTWSATENVLWKREVPGRGWSSPIVWRDRVYFTTVTRDGDAAEKDKEAKRGLYLGGNRNQPSPNVHHWQVLCLDLTNGELLWEKTAHEGVPLQSIHLKNSYASETPATDGERVYAYFGNVGVFCYTLDGKLVWSRPLGTHKTASGWGTGSSPILYKDHLYVLNDNEEQSFLVALDKKTGEEVWRAPRDERSSWSTPYIWENGQRTEIVVSGSGMVRSYDLAGRPLWQLGDMSGNAIPTPLAGPDFLYVSSGHVMGNKKPIMAIRPGATGDITLAADQENNQFVAWCLRQAAPYNPSILLYKGYVYVNRDLGIVSCYDARTGAAAYDKKRLPNGRAFTASPWAYNGLVFCLNEYGDTYVIKAGPEFEVLRVNSLAEDDMYLATPAIAGDRLLVRSDHRLYAIQKGAKIVSR